jgi:O-antigen ligase
VTEHAEHDILAPDTPPRRRTADIRRHFEAFRADLPSGRRAWFGGAVSVGVVLVLGALGGPVAAGLGALALVALVAGAIRTALIGPFVALLLPAGEPAHVLGAQVSPLEAVVGGAALGYLVGVVSRRERPRTALADWVFAALLAAMAISMLGPVDTSDRAREILFWGALGVVFHGVRCDLQRSRKTRGLLTALATSALIEASMGLYEYVDRWSDRFSSLHGAIVYPLPQGSMGHPNALAQFLVLVSLAVLALALAEGGAVRRLGFMVAGAGALALVVTFSRASWIAFAAGASVYLVDRRTRRPVLAGGAVALAAAAGLALFNGGAIGARISSLFGSESSELYDFRFELMGRAARIVAAHPLTGSGHFEESGVYAGRPDLATHPHNLFLGIAVFFGAPAAIAFGALVLIAARSAWRGYRSGLDRLTLTALGFVALVVAFLVNGLLEYPFWNLSLTALVVLSLAIAAALQPVKSTEHLGRRRSLIKVSL